MFYFNHIFLNTFLHGPSYLYRHPHHITNHEHLACLVLFAHLPFHFCPHTWRANAVGAWTFGTDWKMRERSTVVYSSFSLDIKINFRWVLHFVGFSGELIDAECSLKHHSLATKYALIMKRELTIWSVTPLWSPLSPCELLASSVWPAPSRGLEGQMQSPLQREKHEWLKWQ